MKICKWTGSKEPHFYKIIVLDPHCVFFIRYNGQIGKDKNLTEKDLNYRDKWVLFEGTLEQAKAEAV